MKTNVIQTIVLVLVGFALIGLGFLFFISAGGDPTPEYSERVRENWGCFWWVAETLDGILRGIVGAAIMWVGYKVWPFHDEKKPAALEEPDEQEQPETHLIPICNE